MSNNVRCRPWLPDAETVSRIIAHDAERDDEFGTVKERRTAVNQNATAHGHTLHKWSFQGSRRWVTYCARCYLMCIVNDVYTNYGGKTHCGPCNTVK